MGCKSLLYKIETRDARHGRLLLRYIRELKNKTKLYKIKKTSEPI